MSSIEYINLKLLNTEENIKLINSKLLYLTEKIDRLIITTDLLQSKLQNREKIQNNSENIQQDTSLKIPIPLQSIPKIPEDLISTISSDINWNDLSDLMKTKMNSMYE
jgi:hypothetical protein